MNDFNDRLKELLHFGQFLESKVNTYIYLYYQTGGMSSDTVKSTEELKKLVTDFVVKQIRMELVFHGDFDTLYDRHLESEIRYYVNEYFECRYNK